MISRLKVLNKNKFLRKTQINNLSKKKRVEQLVNFLRTKIILRKLIQKMDRL